MKHVSLLLLFSVMSSRCQRRITNGSVVGNDTNTGFVVYLVAAGRYVSKPVWPGWLCSESIIHPAFVVTSSACLVEVPNIYVISGYRKYVKPHKLQSDRCIKRTKRKIVSYCTRRGLSLFSNVINNTNHDWTFTDLAIARVSPVFDFYDSNYLKYCSYLPTAIKINFNGKYDKPGRDVVVYGWGHARYFRPTGDLTDYNEEYLRWARSKIMDLKDCKGHFNKTVFKEVYETINQMGICTAGAGNFDDKGSLVSLAKPIMHGCEENRRSGDTMHILNPNPKREQTNITSNNCTDQTLLNESAELTNRTDYTFNTRRNGICQNDHGSPLVTWIGGKPHLIGTATFFLVKNNMRCVGPYVYTSTRPNSKFISCILEVNNSGNKSRRMATKTRCDGDEDFMIMRKNLTEHDDENLDDLDEFFDANDKENLSGLGVIEDYDLE